MSEKESELKKLFLEDLMSHALQVGAQDNNNEAILISLLKVPSAERTPSMIHIIKDHLKSLEYFKHLVLGDDLIKICRHIELETIYDREVLFEKGD